MTATIQQWVVPEGRGVTDEMVQHVLQDCFKFSQHVRERFRLAFNKRNGAVSRYVKSEQGQVACV